MFRGKPDASPVVGPNIADALDAPLRRAPAELALLDARLDQPASRLDPEESTDADGVVRGFIHSSEITATMNGPGVRYTLFTSGCAMRCLYCHNPDTWQMRMGQRVTVDQVVDDMAKYRRFLGISGGGLTTTGGEPLAQPKFLEALYRRAKDRLGIHVALDTNGYLGTRASDALLDLVDLVLLDVKSGDPEVHRRVTALELEPVLEFGRRLAARGTPLWIRYVLVPGVTDQDFNLRAAADYVRTLSTVERVEVLPYHTMGQQKYEALGWPYPLAGVPAPSPEAVAAARAVFQDAAPLVY